MVKVVVFIASFILLNSLFIIHPVSAQDTIFKEAKINPVSPLYFLKSAKEMLELKFAKTAYDRAKLQLKFTNERIKEVKGLTKNKDQQLIQPTLERYMSSLQTLSGLVNFEDEKADARAIQPLFPQMKTLIQSYQEVGDAEAKRSILAAVYKLLLWDFKLIDKLNQYNKYPLVAQVVPSKELGCDFLIKEASSSALNEVEKIVLGQRVQICSSKN